ncbi:MAG: preprotein translocase subunit YajC [Parvibaculaceae bacterium]|jgi:preprotein translocase subunit YajC|nr:preprotein translocase subunit YajC [Rhodobiaceae bacterium]MAN61571.1 preprotein translocase subunit YajC [Parvibaculum sp.]MDF1846300.1 preprotein translocase subunit YajC [Parvibaculaceae bacterium]WOF73907.1 preprotein translocase subunit YajC [Parvibaculaceae bacterium PLY_AMNH_Bact1]MCR9240893.1 preprotein translocase subunit YajC [Rhodobiaceae bacterium]|tara:strand:- start:1332 stop:1682 length:351 start_codon:yes stop_codon:yes gene_type:complete
MFITPAYAETAAGGGGELLSFVFPLVAIFAIMYFLVIRPQQKRAKDHAEMVNAVRRGDEVITAGGIMGKVTKVSDGDDVQVEIADGVRIKVIKSTLSNVRSKSQPAPDAANTNKDA